MSTFMQDKYDNYYIYVTIFLCCFRQRADLPKRTNLPTRANFRIRTDIHAVTHYIFEIFHPGNVNHSNSVQTIITRTQGENITPIPTRRYGSSDRSPYIYGKSNWAGKQDRTSPRKPDTRLKSSPLKTSVMLPPHPVKDYKNVQKRTPPTQIILHYCHDCFRLPPPALPQQTNIFRLITIS